MQRTYGNSLSIPRLLILTLLTLAACSKGKASRPPKIVPVVAELADRKDIPLQLKTIGNVEAYNAVSIKALVGGRGGRRVLSGRAGCRKGRAAVQDRPRPL